MLQSELTWPNPQNSIESDLGLTEDRRQTKSILLLRRRLSCGGGKPVQFSAFCEKWSSIKMTGTEKWSSIKMTGTENWNSKKMTGTEKWSSIKMTGTEKWSSIKMTGTEKWSSIKK